MVGDKSLVLGCWVTHVGILHPGHAWTDPYTCLWMIVVACVIIYPITGEWKHNLSWLYLNNTRCIGAAAIHSWLIKLSLNPSITVTHIKFVKWRQATCAWGAQLAIKVICKQWKVNKSLRVMKTIGRVWATRYA